MEIPIIILTTLMAILFCIYFIWVAIMVTKQHQTLEVCHTSEGACIKSPLEIETVRYQSMHLHTDYNPEDYDHEYLQEAKFKHLKSTFTVFSSILMIGTALLFIASLVWEVPLREFNMLLFINTLLLSIALFTNNFTENSVLGDYIANYKKLRGKLNDNVLNTKDAGTGNTTPKISTLEDLPDDILKSLINRYSAYHEITNYFKIPVYSEYEMHQKIREVLEKKPNSTTTAIRIDELMRFLKFNYDNDRANLKTDMDILIPAAEAANPVYKLLSGNAFDPYESLKKQYMSIIISLIVITIITIYYIFHSIYTGTEQVGLLVTVIALLVIITVLFLMVYRFTL